MTEKENIYQKITNVRRAWANANIEKEGKGRAGGGAKYDYYKPQQIIDFCLKEETANNLFSEFNTVDDKCYYEVTNIENGEKLMVSCPFAIPKKMAASEAQQVGAALTYFNRRLAMMMYKIEDNSKESVDVLENADYSKAETSTPVIPAPPIKPEPPTSPVSKPNIPNEQTIVSAPKPVINDKPATNPTVISTPPKNKDEDLPPWVSSVVENNKAVKKQEEVSKPKTGSIEALYD